MTTATGTMVVSPVDSAKEVLDKLRQDATWDDVMYHLYVREKIERGLAQIEAGQVHDAEEVFAEFLAEDEDE